MALDRPQLANVNSQFWRGGDTATKGSPVRNRPGIRVILVITEASRALAFGNSPGDAIADKKLQRLLKMAPKRRGTLRIDITNWVKSADWGAARDEKFITLNITLDNKFGLFNSIPKGSMIVIERRKPVWSKTGKFTPMLSCHLWNKNRTITGRSEEMQLELYDRMKWLAEYDVPKKVYRADRAHRQGWTTRQIIVDIARSAGIPVGEISTGFNSQRFKRFETTGSVFDSLQKILKAHKTKTDAVYKKAKKKPAKTKTIIHARDGKLNVITVRDPAKQAQVVKTVPFFNDAIGIEAASVREVMNDEKFATRLLLKASATDTKKNEKGKSRQRVKAKVVTINPSDPYIQKVFGIIEKTDTKLRKQNLNLGTLQKKGREELDKRINAETELEFTTRGYPNLWPGDFILLNSMKMGARGLYSIDKIGYSFQGGQLLMSVVVKGDSLVENSFTKFKVSDTMRVIPPSY
jgi:cellobiose-specific phosphotransferase system component IIA